MNNNEIIIQELENQKNDILILAKNYQMETEFQ